MQKKNETGKKIHICSEFPEFFKANRCQTFLIAPMDHSVKLWNKNFWPISLIYFLTGFHRSWVWRPTTCLKMVLKMVQNCLMGPMFGVFWIILLPWDARNTICLELIGYFSQNTGLIPGRSWFCNFFSSNFVFFEFLFQTFLKILQILYFSIFLFQTSRFWKYPKTCWFSGKSYQYKFCSKFTQLSGKL